MFVNHAAFEEGMRYQRVTSYKIYPRQASEQEDYQVLAENIPAIFKEDLRIIQNKEEIPFWVEEKGKAWAKIAKLMSKTQQQLFALSGNPSASSASNGDNTFEFFDDFEGTSLDATKWNSAGTIVVSNSEASLNADDAMYTISNWGYGYSVIVNAKADEQDTEFAAFRSSTAVSPDDELSLINTDYDYPNDFDRFACRSENGGEYSTVYVDNQLDFRNVYRLYEITRISGEAKYYQDNNLMYTRTSYLPTINLGVGVLVWDSSQASTLILNWIIVRKYTSHEPLIIKKRTGGKTDVIKAIVAGLVA